LLLFHFMIFIQSFMYRSTDRLVLLIYIRIISTRWILICSWNLFEFSHWLTRQKHICLKIIFSQCTIFDQSLSKLMISLLKTWCFFVFIKLAISWLIFWAITSFLFILGIITTTVVYTKLMRWGRLLCHTDFIKTILAVVI